MRRAYVSEGLLYVGAVVLMLGISLVALGAISSQTCSGSVNQFDQVTTYCGNPNGGWAFLGWILAVLGVALFGAAFTRQPRMTCTKCGRELSGEAAFCPFCGQQLGKPA